LSTIPAFAAHNPQTGIIVTDDNAFPPFAFLDAEGNPRGITIDIWTLWSKKTGVPVKFDLMEWDEALKAVREGRADAVGGLFLTPERKAYFDYTKEIIRIPTAIFFHRQIAGIKSLKDLSGFQVGVIRGDSSEELLRTKHPDINLLVYTSTDELVKAAIAGRVRVFVADEPVALFYLAKYPGGETFRHSSREIAINRQYSAVRKGNTLLLSTVQSGFDKISKAEINSIVKEWSGKSTRADIPWRAIGLILIVILIIVAAVLVWNIQLRRRVLRATRDLEERNKELELSREVIRQSEARYRELVEIANSIILRMDKQGQILFFNEFALRFFGFRQEEVLGRNVVGTIVPEKETSGRDLAAMINDIAVNPDIYAKNENENMRSNGDRVWVAWTNKVIYDAKGGVNEILCIGNDITERKQSDEELERVRRRLEAASTAGRVALWELNLTSGRVDWSEAVDKMLGHPPMAFQRTLTAWQDIIHPEDRRRVDEALAAHLDHAAPYDVEYRVQRADGTWVWWRDTGAAQCDEQGKPFSMAGACADVTDRRLAEEALLERQGIINAIVETSQDWIWAIDAEGVHTFSNPAIRTILGREEKEILGRKNLDFLHEEDFAKVQAILPECIRERRGWENLLLRWRHKDGTYHYLESNAVPILDTTGKLHGFRGVDRDITERKRMEQELHESEQRYRLVLEGLEKVAVQGYDPDGTITFWNRGSELLYGFSAQAALGRNILDLLHGPETREAERWLMDEALRTGNLTPAGEVDVINQDGQNLTVYASRILSARPGREPEFFCFDVDITEHKLAEEALRKAKGYAENLINSANAMVIGLNVNGGVQVFNEAAERITGYCKAELEGKNWFEIIVPKERYPQVWKEFLRLMMGGIPGEFENPILTKDGEERIISWRNSELREENQVIGTISFGIDITERRQADEALRASERRLNDIIEFLPDATLVIDPDGKVIAWNRAIETMTGIKKEDMLGKGDYEYALPFYGTRRPILIDLALRRDREMENLYTAMKRYDDVLFGEALTPNLPPGDIHLSATASVLRNTKDEVIAAIECIRDNTERYRLEDQLRQAQKMEAIGTLAGGIAHDFNNILGSVMGYTELAQMKASDAEMERYLDQVLKASDRAKALVAQILTFSRQSSQEKKPLSVTPIFKEVLKLLRSSLPSNIQIRQNFSCPNDAVHADPTQIYQVLMNLCTNAAHAMREEGGILEVTLEPEHIPNPHMHYEYNLKQGDYTKLTVRDNGCGMEPSTIEHIFEPFFTTKKEGEGTGLGLSVVYGIVKDHGGTIHVASQRDKGTTFTVLLPLIERETMPREETVLPIPKGRGHILLVDDEEALARMSREMLTSLGYDVTLRYSSLDALEAFRKNPQQFDLVFTDMTMPNMSGALLAREMLKIRHDIPIILVTGFSERINEEDAKSIGIREFLMKPVSLANLSQTVRKVLDQKDMTGPNRDLP